MQVHENENKVSKNSKWLESSEHRSERKSNFWSKISKENEIYIVNCVRFVKDICLDGFQTSAKWILSIGEIDSKTECQRNAKDTQKER